MSLNCECSLYRRFRSINRYSVSCLSLLRIGFWKIYGVILTKKYEVPRYQREYSWGTDEVDNLWNDLFSDDEFFLGSIVLKLAPVEKERR